MNLDELLLDEMIKVINCIKENRYEELEQQGYLQHISKEEIIQELNIYGGKITTAEYNDYKRVLQYMNINNTNKYKVFLELWIDNERSDLTLICDILIDNDMNILKSTIEEVHVL